MEISEIRDSTNTELAEYTMVETTGTITNVRDLGFAVSFHLEDPTGAYVVVFVRDSIIELTAPDGKLDNVYEGLYATVRGALVWYTPRGSSYGYWEIIPTSADSIVAHGAPPQLEYPEYTLSQLLFNPEDNEGLLVKVSGLRIYEIESAHLFKAAEDSTGGNITIYVEYGGNITGNVTLDSIIDIQGVFTRYNDIWEIKVRASTSDYILVTAEGQEEVTA
ncbi:MAG: hypothetical protein J7L61_00295 [Thermoplasmata archaeon]|nr:hypothetical protein [Thermoplasmata archaeon]